MKVFPNIVVEDVRGLTNATQVQRISFRLRGLHNFFHYQYAEELRLSGATPEQREALRGLRHSPERVRVFDPIDGYLVHRLPEILSFQVEDRTYRVGSAGQMSGGAWNRIDARMYPVATIDFPAPVPLDTALDRIWEWRRFFSQLAMLPLAFRGIAVQGSLEARAPSTNVYLPNLKHPKKATGHYALSAAYLPLNLWEDREMLSETMRAWLSRSTERRVFRSRLDRAIEHLDRRINPDDLLGLASAVEALPQQAANSALTPDVLDAMAIAAHNVPGANTLERNRIRGLLGTLQHPSLASKLQSLGEGLPSVSAADVALIARYTVSIRNVSAHGGALAEQTQPRVAPTIEALATLCAYYDLRASGLPDSAISRLMPLKRYRSAMQELRA